jgi:hypothetical protein
MNGDSLTNALFQIKAELAIARNCLREAVVAAAHDQFAKAKQLLVNAKRSHRAVGEQISRLPPKYDARSQTALARILEGDIDELEQQILKNERHHEP